MPTTDNVHDPTPGVMTGPVRPTRRPTQPPGQSPPIEIVERYVARVKRLAAAQRTRARRGPDDGQNTDHSKA
jgi:hypothetical protein